MSSFYVGIDLHAKNMWVCVIDEKGVVVKEKKLKCSLEDVLLFLEPYGKGIMIAIVSTPVEFSPISPIENSPVVAF